MIKVTLFHHMKHQTKEECLICVVLHNVFVVQSCSVKHNPLSGWHHSLCYMNAVNILKAVIQFDFIEFVYITVFCISTSIMPSWQSVWWHEVYRWYKVFDCGRLDYLCLKAHGWHTRSLLEHSVLALRLTDAKRDEGTASFFSSLSPSTCSFNHPMIS